MTKGKNKGADKNPREGANKPVKTPFEAGFQRDLRVIVTIDKLLGSRNGKK